MLKLFAVLNHLACGAEGPGVGDIASEYELYYLQCGVIHILESKHAGAIGKHLLPEFLSHLGFVSFPYLLRNILPHCGDQNNLISRFFAAECLKCTQILCRSLGYAVIANPVEVDHSGELHFGSVAKTPVSNPPQNLLIIDICGVEARGVDHYDAARAVGENEGLYMRRVGLEVIANRRYSVVQQFVDELVVTN